MTGPHRIHSVQVHFPTARVRLVQRHTVIFVVPTSPTKFHGHPDEHWLGVVREERCSPEDHGRRTWPAIYRGTRPKLQTMAGLYVHIPFLRQSVHLLRLPFHNQIE